MSSRIPKLLATFMLCGGLLFSQWAYALAAQEQDAAPAQPTAQPAKEASAPADQKAGLAAPMDKDLSFLLGKWDTKMKIFPNALSGNTEEVQGGGAAEFRAFGKIIEGTFVNETSSGKYEFKEFMWYDQDSKIYNIVSISSEGHAIDKTMKRTNSSEKFVIHYSGVDKIKGGKEVPFTVQAKYKIVSDTEVKYYSEVKIGKADFVPFLQIRMQRISK